MGLVVKTKQEEAAEKSRDMRCGPHKELGCLECWSNIILNDRYDNYNKYKNRAQKARDTERDGTL